MKKSKFIIVLLFVGVLGCVPELTREEKLAVAFSQHPEWSAYHKQLIEKRNIVTGMTVEQVEVAWGMYLTCEYTGSSGRARYVGYNCSSAHAQALLRGRKYEQMYYGNLHGTYSFWFKDGGLEDWSWSRSCPFVYLYSY